MHQATHISPSDIKPVLGVLKSILGTCPAKQAGQHTSKQGSTCHSSGHTGQQATSSQHTTTQATSWDHQQPPQAGQLTACTTGHQQAAACQHWAELGRSADQAKNPAKTSQKQARSKRKKPLLMTLCIFPEKSIIQLFHYCMRTVLYMYSTTFSLLYIYSNTKSLHKNDDFSRTYRGRPPLPKNLDPFFYCQIAKFLHQNFFWFFTSRPIAWCPKVM